MMQKKCGKCKKLSSNLLKYCSQCGFKLPEDTMTDEIKGPEKKPKNRNKILQLIVGVIAFGISYFAVQQLFNNPQTFDKAMMKAASEINKSCPIMVDNDTRLDNTMAMPNNVFQYNYTLVNFEKSEVNIEKFRDFIEPNVVNNIKTNPEMKAYKENRVTMAYYYKDKNGKFVLKIDVTPEKYE